MSHPTSEPDAPEPRADAAAGRPRESRTARFAWSAGLSWVQQGLALVVGLWLTRFLLGRLGEGILGWWAQALVIVSYLAMADFGLSSLLPREVAAAAARAGGWRAAGELPELIARYVRFAAWQAPLAAVIAAAFSCLLTRTAEFPVWPTVGLMAVATLAFPLRVGAALLAGLQDVRFAGLVPIAVYLSGVTVTVASVSAGAGVVGLVLGWATQTLLTSGLIWARLLTRYRAVLPSARQVLAARLPTRMLADGGWAWMAAVGATLAGTAEILVIGWFYPPEVVFRYSCTTRLVVALSPLALGLCQAALPAMAELRAAAEPERVRRAILAYTQLLLGVSGLFVVVLLAVNRGFVGWWVGPDKYLGDAVTAAAVAGMALRHGLNVLVVVMFCLNRERRLWALTLVDGMASVAATAAWVGWGGVRWAPLGPLTAVAGLTLPAILFAIAAERTVPVGRLLGVAGLWAVLTAAVTAGGFVLGRAVRPDHPLSLALVGAATGLVYLAVMAVPALRSELGGYLRQRFGRPRA